MAANETSSSVTTSEITTDLNVPAVSGDASLGTPLYPPQGPVPKGTRPESAAQLANETPANPIQGAGVEGEEVVWEARYAMKNFSGRIAARTFLSIAWVALAIYTWGYGHRQLTPVAVVFGVVVVLLWLALLYRMVQARYGHYYRLTTRRLFVSTGLMRRRRDMLELLRVKDVFTRQTWVERCLSLGTVVVVSSDRDLPTFYVSGVNDPKRVMDLIWHYARAERDRRSMKVEQV